MPYLRRYLTIVGVILAAAIAARAMLGVPSWVTAGVLLIGWPVVGTIITIDDDFPGGWSNPDGKSVPEWKKLWWWADLFLVRGSLVLLAFTVEEAISGRFAYVALIAIPAMAAIGIPCLVRGMRREFAHAA